MFCGRLNLYPCAAYIRCTRLRVVWISAGVTAHSDTSLVLTLQRDIDMQTPESVKQFTNTTAGEVTSSQAARTIDANMLTRGLSEVTTSVQVDLHGSGVTANADKIVDTVLPSAATPTPTAPPQYNPQTHDPNVDNGQPGSDRDKSRDIFDERFMILMDGFGETCKSNDVELALAIAVDPVLRQPIMFVKGNSYKLAKLTKEALRRLKALIIRELDE